jgi:hypothetical protein
MHNSLAQNSGRPMGYRGWGRGRGRGFGRGAAFRRDSGQGFGYSSRQGFGMGQGRELSPFCSRFPDRPKGWWADPAYSNITTQHSQQNVLEYQYARPEQHMQRPELLVHAQSPIQSFAAHMNCVHYSNGFCTLRNVAVPPDGPSCRSFAPR